MSDKTNAIYIRITPVDEAYEGMHPDLIAQDIMPTYTTGVQWERVEAMPISDVVEMMRCEFEWIDDDAIMAVINRHNT